MYEVYKINYGDTLRNIAINYGVDEDILMQINGLVNEDISNMEYLVVPRNETPFQYYTVKKGDNIYNIAKMFEVDYELLLKLNGLDDNDYIYPNQTIIIPRNNYRVYVTKDGDTLANLSREYDIAIEELVNENRNVSLISDQIIVIREK